MPAYNSEEHIERAMNSVLDQSYQNIELIVVNDGSIDQTKDIVLEIKQADDRIKYFENVNSGVSVARNIGLTHATGEYVGFVDADDYIENNMISLLIDKAEEYNCDLVSCAFERIHRNIVVPEKTKIRAGYYNKDDLTNTIYPLLFGNRYLEPLLPLNIVTKLFKREIIEKNSISFEKDLKFGEDLLFTQLFLLNSDSFYFLPNEKLYKYTYNSSSATNKYHKNKWHNLKIGLSLRKKIIEKYPKDNLEDQISYAVIRSSIEAIKNAGRNTTVKKHERFYELSNIIMDKDVQKALKVSDHSGFDFKTKIVVKLMERKKIKEIYIIQQYLKKLI